MTLKECYNRMGGNYEDVLGRLRRESLVEKFVLKFIDDKSYSELCNAFEENKSEDAFRAAHTIKGVCQNLGFDLLFASSSKLTETLRDSTINEESILLLDKVKQDYAVTVAAIKEYQNG